MQFENYYVNSAADNNAVNEFNVNMRDKVINGSIELVNKVDIGLVEKCCMKLKPLKSSVGLELK